MTQLGLYRWLRLKFGLVGAPAFFQYIMDLALAGEVDVDAYLDDCSCAGADWKAFGGVLCDPCINLQISV